MSTIVPHKGMFTIDEWAACLGVETETLKDNLKAGNLRYVSRGNDQMLIDAELFWTDIQKMNGTR